MIYNKILRYYSSVLRYTKEKTRLQTGFTMLEAVVVVGVLLALAIGGLFAYGPIVANAKLAKLKSVASEVYTAATVYQIDGDPKTKPQDALDAFNASSTTIKVGFFDTKVVATPAMTTGEYVPAQDEDFCIQATDVLKPELEAKSGDCPAPAADATSPSESPSPSTPPKRILTNLQNGDFSDGLNHWEAVGGAGIPPVASNGVATIYSSLNVARGIFQKVSIPDDGITYAGYTYGRGRYTGVANFVVSAYDLSGKLIKEIKRHSIPDDKAVAMNANTLDLTEFAGQDIKLGFQILEDQSGVPVTVDDISVQNITTPSSAPLNVKTVITDADAAISWDRPLTGDLSVTSYTVTPYRDGDALPTIQTSGNPPATSATFKGLSNGGTYTFKVTAVNKNGNSAQSESSAPYYRPALLLTNGDFSAGLTGWSAIGGAGLAPSVSGGVATIYSATNVARGVSQTISIPSKGITYTAYSFSRGRYTGVANFLLNAYAPDGTFIKEVKRHSIPNDKAVAMTEYTADLTEFAGQDIKLAFQTLHDNNGVPVSVDNISVQNVTTAPNAPTNVVISVSDTDATVSWTRPSSGANTVTEYEVTPYRNGTALPTLKTSGAPAATSTVFKGLTNGGQYTFKVVATNRLGTSEQSVSSAPYNRGAQTWTNGDFANGLTGWSSIGGAGTAPSVSGGVAAISTSTNIQRGISQTLSVPANGNTSVGYSYARGRYTGITTFIVSAYAPDGTFIKEIKRHSIPDDKAIVMTASTADLTEFAGRDIKLAFEVLQNSNGIPVNIDNTFIMNQ